MNETFWMVYAHGSGSPSFVHNTVESARAEAERLSRDLKRPCSVMQCIATVTLAPTPVIWTDRLIENLDLD